jgi:hypothetical protein
VAEYTSHGHTNTVNTNINMRTTAEETIKLWTLSNRCGATRLSKTQRTDPSKDVGQIIRDQTPTNDPHTHMSLTHTHTHTHTQIHTQTHTKYTAIATHAHHATYHIGDIVAATTGDDIAAMALTGGDGSVLLHWITR